MATNQALAEIATRHQVYLERLKTGEVNKFEPFLRRMDKSIRDRLAGNELTDFARGRLEKLLTSVERDLDIIHGDFRAQLELDLFDLADYEAAFEARSLDQVVESFETVVPAENQVRAAVMSQPLSVRGPDGGKLLQPFLEGWSRGEVQRVTGAIRQGFFEGQTNAEIVRTIRGTRANNYRDGLLAVTQRHASTVVRTAVQHTASQARQETWKRNKDIAKGVRWVATLDARTSQQCRSLDGILFPLDKGPRPPIHLNCRSTTILELNDKFSALKKGKTRASVDGQVDADLSYYEWLKRQSPEFQDTAIGPVRGKLLRDGGLTAERFAELNIGRNFEPLTLAEMRALEPLAFEKAGI